MFFMVGVKGCVLRWVPTRVQVGFQGMAQSGLEGGLYFKVRLELRLKSKVGKVGVKVILKAEFKEGCRAAFNGGSKGGFMWL